MYLCSASCYQHSILLQRGTCYCNFTHSQLQIHTQLFAVALSFFILVESFNLKLQELFTYMLQAYMQGNFFYKTQKIQWISGDKSGTITLHFPQLQLYLKIFALSLRTWSLSVHILFSQLPICCYHRFSNSTLNMTLICCLSSDWKYFALKFRKNWYQHSCI